MPKNDDKTNAENTEKKEAKENKVENLRDDFKLYKDRERKRRKMVFSRLNKIESDMQNVKSQLAEINQKIDGIKSGGGQSNDPFLPEEINDAGDLRIVIEVEFPDLVNADNLKAGKSDVYQSKYWWAGKIRDFLVSKYNNISSPWGDSNVRHFDAFVITIDMKRYVVDFVKNSDGGGSLYDDVQFDLGEVYNG